MVEKKSWKSLSRQKRRYGVLGVGIAYRKVIINMNVRVNGDKDFGNTC